MSTVVDTTAVDELAAAITAAGVTASADPSRVRTPGAWLRHTGFSLDRLAGFTHQLEIHLVTGDTGYLAARDALLDAATLVLTVLDPDADPFFQGLQLPGGHPLPGLVIPFNLPSDYTFEE